MTSEYDDFARRMIEIAGAHREKMINEDMSEEEAYAYVKHIIEATPIVFGVFPKSSNTFGLHVIKGQREMSVVVASAEPEKFEMSAIPCLDIEQAMTAEDELGDGRLKAN